MKLIYSVVKKRFGEHKRIKAKQTPDNFHYVEAAILFRCVWNQRFSSVTLSVY